ncbi:hypothetical protein ACEWY4_011514 [Coilia grayii]|uniref:Uncharacterized protein n=1 Tax=Coilia grayii TaxID=363190 RepID=A0ABD1JXU2_9TELE
MKAIIVLFGGLCLCFAAPVSYHPTSFFLQLYVSDAAPWGLRTLLTEVKETLANVNRNTKTDQPAVEVPHEEQSRPSTGVSVQAPEPGPAHSPDPNTAAPGAAQINLVISTQPQQPQAGSPPPQDTPTDPNTLLLPPCSQTAAQQPSAQVTPCYVIYNGFHHPGLSPFLPHTSLPMGSHLNPYTYPGIGYSYGVSPINPMLNPYARYNSPIDPHIHPFAGPMSPPLGMTPPIIFRQGQTPSRGQ